jgi:hypothetical protein
MTGKSHDEREQWQAKRAEWRARREVRRARQRLENVGRAKKMHAARIAHDCPDQPLAQGRATCSTPELRIGCSGWYYWHWKGLFYPESTPSSRWFDHYASKFNTVELNAPF